jgi:hypothetical protein
MIKFYLHLIDPAYYKALEHTVDCIGNNKKVVYIYILTYVAEMSNSYMLVRKGPICSIWF